MSQPSSAPRTSPESTPKVSELVDNLSKNIQMPDLDRSEGERARNDEAIVKARIREMLIAGAETRERNNARAESQDARQRCTEETSCQLAESTPTGMEPQQLVDLQASIQQHIQVIEGMMRGWDKEWKNVHNSSMTPGTLLLRFTQSNAAEIAQSMTNLFDIPEGLSDAERKRYTTTQNLFKNVLGIGHSVRPSIEDIVEAISAEIDKGERGLMPYIWMSMSFGNQDLKQSIAAEYIKVQSDAGQTEKIRAFLREGNQKGIFSPTDMTTLTQGIDGLNFTEEELERFAQQYEEMASRLEEGRRHIQSYGSQPAFGDWRTLGNLALNIWGGATAIANAMVAFFNKGFVGGLKSLPKNPTFIIGAGAVAVNTIRQRGGFETENSEGKRAEAEMAIRLANGQSAEITGFFGNEEKGENRRIIFDGYVQTLEAGGDLEKATAESLLEYLGGQEERGSIPHREFKAEFESLIEGRGSIRTNSALRALAKAFNLSRDLPRQNVDNTGMTSPTDRQNPIISDYATILTSALNPTTPIDRS
jgi:hypothetical protein